MDAPSTEKTGLHKGDVIDGQLEIEGVIGEGRISAVVSAIERETNKRVAVKLLRVSDLESVERFRRAARGMAKLTSPYAVRVLRVGETQDGSPCMSMEYLEGKTLAQHLTQRGPFPIEEATRWMIEACEAIADAHEQKLLHRDIDAENLFLAMPKVGTLGQASIRVLDFGLAPVWRLGKGDGRAKPGEVPGTSLALAPELARGSDLDERVDIWGIGACLYRLLTNKYPYSARNLAELCTRVLGERAPDVSKSRPEVSPMLATLIARCLEREPSDWYKSVQEVIEALYEARDDAPNTPQVPTEQMTLDEMRMMTPRAQPALPPPDSTDDETSVFQGISQSAKRTPKVSVTGTGPQLPKVELPKAEMLRDAAPPSLGVPETIPTATPAFDALASKLEPPKKALPSTKPPPKIPSTKPPPPLKVQPPTLKMPTTPPPRPEPITEDGPSTQPLGRMSPFAGKQPRKAEQGEPPSSDHTVKPQLVPMTMPHPLPKPSPKMMAQETIQDPTAIPQEDADDPTSMMLRPMPRPLPKPSPALQAQDTIPRGGSAPVLMELPKPPAAFEAPAFAPTVPMPAREPIPFAPTVASPIYEPPPPERIVPVMSAPPPPMTSGLPPPLIPYPKEEPPPKQRGLVVALVFALGIAASIVIGLYVARATMPKAPVAAGLKASATPTTSAAEPVASDSLAAGPDTTTPITDTDPTPVASASASAIAHHHHHAPPAPRAQPRPEPGPAPAPAPAPAPTKTSVYDPGNL